MARPESAGGGHDDDRPGFNGRLEATRYLSQVGSAAALSVITRAEVLAGFSPAEAAVAVRLLDRFPTLGIDTAVADLAAHLRREHRWKMPDALQAALARHHGLVLATRNTRDFPPEAHSFVVIPYLLKG